MSYQIEKSRFDREVDERAAELIRQGTSPFAAIIAAQRQVEDRRCMDYYRYRDAGRKLPPQEKKESL